MDNFELALNEFLFQHEELKEINDKINTFTFNNTDVNVNIDNIKRQLNEGIYHKSILSHKGFLEMEFFLFTNLKNKIKNYEYMINFRSDLYSRFLILRKYKIKLNFYKLFFNEEEKMLTTLVCFKDGDEFKILPMDLSSAIFLTDLFKTIKIKNDMWYI